MIGKIYCASTEGNYLLLNAWMRILDPAHKRGEQFGIIRLAPFDQSVIE
jgi:hypothetical protein